MIKFEVDKSLQLLKNNKSLNDARRHKTSCDRCLDCDSLLPPLPIDCMRTMGKYKCDWCLESREDDEFYYLMGAIVCIHCLENKTETEDMDDAKELANQLLVRLKKEPIKDGFTHSAEAIVLDMISRSTEGYSELVELISKEGSPVSASEVLRLVGRVGRLIDEPWRRIFIQLAFKSPSLILREAAIEAVEQWGTQDMIPLLRAHVEPVPWLKTYIKDVINDLTRTST